MPIPQTKAELLTAIIESYRKLAPELASIPPERTAEASLEGHSKGTLMSVHDLAAYLLGWGELVLKWHAGRAAGQVVDFPETGFKWNELGQLAAKFYRDYADLPYPELLARLDATKTALVALVEGESDTALYGVPWYETWTLGRMVQFNTASPYANARARLRKWKKQQGLD
ncbi:ClbS/DfsB family four-helix bundle protein [Devosia sp. FKR38]|uniref:ClbS/DfsB family four-helix bundle protein n=1 Tax=Devosia sp. FKR38 TaxID=2562312 RepID=UPI0010C13E86|nr:ClbS/DfsB family four-helix bundle protein [Devosia sp. FKR38]